MKKVLFAVAALLMLATPGLAADVEAPAGYDWTGPYLGLQAGYAWGDTDYSYDPVDSSIELEFDGFVGGVTAGYNAQVEQFVLGVEADISYSDLDDDVLTNSGIFEQDAPCFVEGCSLDINWFGTLRARLGYAFDTVMPFVTGGIAFGDVEGSFDEGACGCSINETAFGWTVGGGIEWAFDARWSAKAEYLYVNLGEPDREDDTGEGITGNVSTSDFDFSVVRLGVNYRL